MDERKRGKCLTPVNQLRYPSTAFKAPSFPSSCAPEPQLSVAVVWQRDLMDQPAAAVEGMGEEGVKVLGCLWVPPCPQHPVPGLLSPACYTCITCCCCTEDP